MAGAPGWQNGILMANSDRIQLMETIDLWHAIAVDQVDDIRGWRGSTDEDWDEIDMPNLIHDRIVSGRGWDHPRNFYTVSSVLVRLIAAQFPQLDAKPIQEVYAAVETWHNERNAKNLPSQTTLQVTLDKAEMTLQAIQSMLIGEGEAKQEELPAMPKVEYNHKSGTIFFRGKTHDGVDTEACMLLKELIDAHPDWKGLTSDSRPQPRRIIEKLPEPIREVIVTSNKGSRIEVV